MFLAHSKDTEEQIVMTYVTYDLIRLLIVVLSAVAFFFLLSSGEHENRTDSKQAMKGENRTIRR